MTEVARDLWISEDTPGNQAYANKRHRGDGKGALDEDERADLARLRKENAELAMERDVLIDLVGRRAWAGRGRLVMSSPIGVCLRPARIGVSGSSPVL
jgi:hypothetical protein